MILSEIKKILATAQAVNFKLANGIPVPEHFHVTEVGVITKDFIDCGGVVRHERVANFQLWDANDYEHRLKAEKLINIISMSEKILGIEDLEIEVEYQAETIGKYDLGFDGTDFLLLPKKTACLAIDQCGIHPERQKIQMVNLASTSSSCTPGGGCC